MSETEAKGDCTLNPRPSLETDAKPLPTGRRGFDNANGTIRTPKAPAVQPQSIALRVHPSMTPLGVEMPYNAKGAPTYRQRLRKRLLSQMGDKCARCGATGPLQFDTIRPTGWKSHGAGAINRLWHYIKQARLGNVQLLCPACHRIKTREDRARKLSTSLCTSHLPY